MDFLNQINLYIVSIQSAFEFIFPEYPFVGLIVCGLALGLFLYYFIRADLKHALKISGSVFAVMVFILFMLHSLDRIFFA